MDNFDPYNVLLAIATNIPVLLMTAFVLQDHIFQCSAPNKCRITDQISFISWGEADKTMTEDLFRHKMQKSTCLALFLILKSQLIFAVYLVIYLVAQCLQIFSFVALPLYL